MVGDFANKNILIVGLGLMGGSMAKALKAKSNIQIWAFDQDENTLNQALKDGIIEKGFTDAKTALMDADIIIICLYPKLVIEFMVNHMADFKSGALISDICGVKKPVVDGIVGHLRDDIDFVPAHPMAGSERQGYAYSFASLFENCHYIITPLASNTPASLATISNFAMMLGAKDIVISTPEAHDENIAYTSQIPHALAIAYMHTSKQRDVLPFAGGSFRDVSRVALINDVMWTELFNQNDEKLVAELKALQLNLTKITELIEKKDIKELKEYMKQGATIKENYDASIDS